MASPRTDKRYRSLTPDEEHERRNFQRENNQAAIDLLDRLMSVNDEEVEDQRETLEYLMRILNEDRDAQAMPVPLQGQTVTAEDLTEEEILATQARRLDVLAETLMNVSDEEAQEQRETWEYLRVALNEDRLSERRRVP